MKISLERLENVAIANNIGDIQMFIGKENV